ncbi:MAG: helix-turn-helix domain-containing protein [Xenococcaceae cyanobacterium MO_188.B29]|nr:helix-turn-helix domain-containing protein [Xenococcaceae cyanobacterium MO_188.B29]
MKNRLKELRQLQQWSQSDLARKLAISRQAVNGFESGKFDPSLDMAFKIANVFNVTLEDIFIHEAKNSMQVLAERVKNFFGFEFGFERFTEKAINALNFARNKATQAQTSLVEPEHILAGLLADANTTSARLLRSNGVVLDIETNEHSFEYWENIKFSSKSKFILELALQIVRLQGQKSIGTEHLLWGLVRLAETDSTIMNDLLPRSEINLVSLNKELAEIV